MKKITLKTWLLGARGRSTQTARYFGVSLSLVSMWAHGTRLVTADRCLSLERLSKGALKAEWIRPDLSFARWTAPVVRSGRGA